VCDNFESRVFGHFERLGYRLHCVTPDDKTTASTDDSQKLQQQQPQKYNKLSLVCCTLSISRRYLLHIVLVVPLLQYENITLYITQSMSFQSIKTMLSRTLKA